MSRLTVDQWEQARPEYEVRGVSLGAWTSVLACPVNVSMRARAGGWTQRRLQDLVGRKVAAVKELAADTRRFPALGKTLRPHGRPR